MLKYIFKRLLVLILLSVTAISIAFMVLHLLGDHSFSHPFISTATDGTPENINAWREARGLNDPILIQYTRYMAGIFRGDLGNSFRTGVPVAQEVMQRFSYTLRLSLIALSAALLLAVPMGIIAALKRNTWIDSMSMFIALIGISIPLMWLGILLIIWQINFGWISPSGAITWDRFIQPAITLGVGMMAAMIRSTRSSVLEAMEQNYIKAAKAKGLSDNKIIRKHILPNIVIPVLASVKANLGVFFTGILIVENTFVWPGIGRLMRQGVAANDYPMVLGCLLMFILFFAFINFIVDIAKAFADPVMRREYR